MKATTEQILARFQIIEDKPVLHRASDRGERVVRTQKIRDNVNPSTTLIRSTRWIGWIANTLAAQTLLLIWFALGQAMEPNTREERLLLLLQAVLLSLPTAVLVSILAAYADLGISKGNHDK